MVREGIVLGHLVSKRGIEVDRTKIEVIEQLPPPVNIRGIRSFLGHCGFCRCHTRFQGHNRVLTICVPRTSNHTYSDKIR
jgi:hypothetical protein